MSVSKAVAQMQFEANERTNAANKEIAASTNEANKAINESTNKANLSLANQQNQWNLEQWNRENAYNSPASQAQRLREAGLSSAAAAQAVANVPAANLQSANLANQQVGNPMVGATMQSPPDSAFARLAEAGNFIGIARQIAQMAKDFSEAKKSEFEANIGPRLVFTDLQAKEVANKLAWQDFMQREKSNPLSLRGMQYDLRLKKHEIVGKKLANETQAVTRDLMKQNFSFLEKKNEKDLQAMTEQIFNLVEERKKIIAETKKTKSDTDLNVEQKKLLSNEVFIKDLEGILIKHGNPQSVAQRVAALVSEGKLTKEDLYDDYDNISYYINSGCQRFKDDSKVIPFLENVFDEGSSRVRGLPLNSIGGLRSLRGKGFNVFKDNPLFNIFGN